MNSALYTATPLMESIGWTLIHSVWQGIAWACFLACAMSLFSQNEARKRYLAAWIALVGMSAGMLITFVYLSWSALPSLSEPTASGINQAALVYSLSGLESSALPQWSAWIEAQLPRIVLFWMIGVGLLMIRWTGGWLYARQFKTRGCHPVPYEYDEIMKRLIDRLSIGRDVRLKLSEHIQSPAVIGHLKPIILLPIALPNALSTREVEAILAHELSHIARKDYLWHIVQIALETLCFYHPGVWYISSQLRKERENACDATAVELTGNAESYANTLVKLQEMKGRKPVLAMGFSGGRKSNFFQRIQRILYPNAQNQLTMEKGIISIAGLILTVWVTGQLWAIQPAETYNPADQTMTVQQEALPRDTAPEEQNHSVIIMERDNGEQWKIVRKNGEIVEMTKNGEPVPPEDYPEEMHDIDIVRTHVETDTPPPPPKAPNAADLQKEVEEEIRVRSEVEVRQKREEEREQVEEERIEIRKHMEELRKKQRELQERLREELRQHDLNEEEIEEHMERFGEHMGRLGERMGELGHELGEHFNSYSFDADGLKWTVRPPNVFFREQDIEIPEPPQWNVKAPHIELFQTGVKARGRSVGDQILHILDEEGALDEEEDDYKIVLTDKKLKVNGSRQDDDLHERIRDLYEERTGMEVEDGSRIVWKND